MNYMNGFFLVGFVIGIVLLIWLLFEFVLWIGASEKRLKVTGWIILTGLFVALFFMGATYGSF
jgi:hypothetical protein